MKRQISHKEGRPTYKFDQRSSFIIYIPLERYLLTFVKLVISGNILPFERYQYYNFNSKVMKTLGF